MRDSFDVSGPLSRLFSRLKPVTHGSIGQPGFGEVLSDSFRLALNNFRKFLLEGIGKCGMDLYTSNS